MAHIEIENGTVRVQLSTAEKFWAVHGSLAIPLAHITRAHVETESGWNHFWRKIVGTGAPGLKMAGTFWVNGGFAFLDYGSGENCLVLDTQHETYKSVIVQIDPDQDVHAVADEVNGRIAAK